MASAVPCFSRGNTLSNEDCDSGMRAAPHAPWIARKITSSGSEVAMPHSIEAMVNPATLIRSTGRSPIRNAMKPTSGVAIALVTMYEVRTQRTWSGDACKLPWMWGSATFAIVVSIAYSIVANMVEATTRPRLTRPSWVMAQPVRFALRPDRARPWCRRAPSRSSQLAAADPQPWSARRSGRECAARP